ncbi:MFS transporter [Streptomyces sp. Amel2xB2]|uniref:OFA family MFS transporter n=1 Tax=Streptomyces sp. Amel2xB2 TaxID=1305829 RepID=UPI000DC042C2|nr:OFA family MFS transporter [Streptomyces sp. Amel2xB2]RAJ68777.1 MFS transporter [Streptomyces sp. Amel2xB2]
MSRPCTGGEDERRAPEILRPIGLGLGYISPVSALIKWFPDRPGLATGMAIVGFGGGAMVAAPLSRELLAVYGGDRPGGDAVMRLFLTLGAAYFVVMMFGVSTVRVPAPGWAPPHFDPARATSRPMVTAADVSAANAVRTPQFWLLWTVLLCNVTAGIGILEQSAEMIQDFFRDADSGTSSVTTGVAAGFVGLLSVANMAGRFVWSTTSDYLGRKPTYVMYLGVGVLLYLLLVAAGSSSTALFILMCAVIISYYGGGFSTVPAYLRDLFGTYQVGAIHGRLLTAWSTAGVLGPLIVDRVLDSRGTPGRLAAADYRPAQFIMAGVLAVGFVANLLIRPVSERRHEKSPVVDAVDAAHGPAGRAYGARAPYGVQHAHDGGEFPLVTGPGAEHTPDTYKARIAVAWTFVVLVLAYGLLNAVTAALQLFTG